MADLAGSVTRPPSIQTSRRRCSRPVSSLGPFDPVSERHGPALGPQGSALGLYGPSLGPFGPASGPRSPALGPQGSAVGFYGPALGPFGPDSGPRSPALGPQGSAVGLYGPALGPFGPDSAQFRSVYRLVSRRRPGAPCH